MSVSYDGVDCGAVNLEVLNIKRPLLPETKDEYIDLPHRSGSILIPDSTFKDIEIEIEFMFEKPKGVNFYQSMRQVAKWLHKTERKPLVFTDDPGTTYQAKVINNVDPERIASYGTFTVKFRALPLEVE